MPLALVICPNANTARTVNNELRSLGIEIRHTVENYPDDTDMSRLLHVYTPDVVFVHCMYFTPALQCISSVEASGAGTPVIALDCPEDPSMILSAVRRGVRELITLPVSSDQLAVVDQNLQRVLNTFRPDYTSAASIHCFVPARPGVGTSVVAANVAFAAAEITGKRILLCDLDPATAMVSFLTRAPAASSVRNVLEHASRIDADIWDRFVHRLSGVDILAGGGTGPADLAAAEVKLLFRFLARLYDMIFIDMSGALEPFSVDLIRSARHTHVVTTPEVPALHFGRAKAEAMRVLEITDRISAIVNRDCPESLETTEIERLIHLPVSVRLTNDYKRVNAAAMRDGRIDRGSALGRQIHAFAASLCDDTTTAVGTASKKHSFRNLFTRLIPQKA